MDETALRQVILPQMIRTFMAVHRSKAHQKISRKQYHKANCEDLQRWLWQMLDFVQNLLHQIFHEKFNNCGKSQTGRKRGKFSQMKRHLFIIPICKITKIFHGFSKQDFTDAHQNHHQEKICQIYHKSVRRFSFQPFLRRADNQINSHDRQSVSQQKWKVHISVVDILLCDSKPYIFNAVS